MTMRNEINHPFADLRTAIKRRHVRFRPCFIDENEIICINYLLEVFPFLSFFGDVLAVLFGGTKRLFSK